jgi:hypothetical protein
MSTDQLGESCAAITKWLPVAQALTTEADADGITGGDQPSSRPPWNSAVENAVMDAHEGLRRLEAAMRRDVTGHTGPRRGGSDANTAAALTAIENLGHAVTTEAMAAAARILDRWSMQIQVLPAVDTEEPWRRVTGRACPYCGVPMLRVKPRAGIVTCLRYGACYDNNGRHPKGQEDVSVLNGNPVIRWDDGLVT